MGKKSIISNSPAGRADERPLPRERMLPGFLEAAPDAIVIVNANGRIVLVNSQTERLFGYSRAEMIGRELEILMPARFRARHQAHREGYIRAPQARVMGSGLEFQGLRKDGSEFPAEISLAPMESVEGVLVASAIRDITERKRLERTLLLANRELEAFSYSVAHDLRAPLRGMNGFAQALLEDYSDKLDEEGRDHLREIQKNALQMGALIDALLSLSRVSCGELQPERMDLALLARSIATRLAAEQHERSVQVQIETGLSASADPSLARILLENLIENAWKFTTRTCPARVEIGSLESGGGRAFFVRDNGAGFDMAYGDKLFGPFQRLHSAAEFPGTGIGLATARRIVHRHGGRIWAESQVGKGATFFFTLPETGETEA
jgi:PAS domain S-box-containing protein